MAGWIGRVGGPVAAIAVYLFLPEGDGLTAEGHVVAAFGVLMAVFWMTEALPLPATSLLPLVLFPMSGVLTFSETAAPYANKFIFLFLGGFMIARAIERWGLHRRIALVTVLAVGTEPVRLVGGFMLATAGLSMWISNTASTMLMLPIAVSSIGLLASQREKTAKRKIDQAAGDNFATCLLLGVAYAASIGGVSTLIGTPPNAFMAGFLEEKGVTIGFAQWMAVGVPISATFLVITWLMLTRWIYPVSNQEFPGGRQLIQRELAALGRVSRGEWTVLGVFLTTALMWIVRKPLTDWTWLTQQMPAVKNLNDAVIAMTGALALFAIPVDRKRGLFALDWESAEKLPWGVLLIFGGGLSLAAAVGKCGLTEWIGGWVGSMGGLPVLAIIAAVVVIVIFLTELTSNIATTAAFLPILYGVALGLGVQEMMLIVPATLAASCAFMLPVATPPNAIVFASGHLTVGKMVRAGLWLNLIGIALILLCIYTLAARVLGIELQAN